jgi:hypothetical protein
VNRPGLSGTALQTIVSLPPACVSTISTSKASSFRGLKFSSKASTSIVIRSPAENRSPPAVITTCFVRRLAR